MELKKEILAIMLQGMQAQMNAGILAINVQAAKGRTPNWQAQSFISNTSQNLLQFGVTAPAILDGTLQQQQPDMLGQLTQVLKASDDKSSKTDTKVYHLSKDVKQLEGKIDKILDAINTTPVKP